MPIKSNVQHKNVVIVKPVNNIPKLIESKTKNQDDQLSINTNKRIARTRRQRGYNWEDTLVKRFNALDGWKAFRLGSPSVALPDILAVSTNEKKRLAVGKYEHRELREFYKVWDESNKITDFVCTYEGKTYALVDGNRQDLELESYDMPFTSKYQIT